MAWARDLIGYRSVMYKKGMAESAFRDANMFQAPKVLTTVSQLMRKWRYRCLRLISKQIPIFPPSGAVGCWPVIGWP